LEGLQFALTKGWYNFRTFNLSEYEHYEKVANGDLNWIIPGKLIAFSSPSDTLRDSYGNKPEMYSAIFKRLNVAHIVRLNQPLYDKKVIRRQ
jgi:cell division cycle 14